MKKARIDELVSWQDELLCASLRVDVSGSRGPPLMNLAPRGVLDCVSDSSPLTDSSSSFIDDVIMGALAHEQLGKGGSSARLAYLAASFASADALADIASAPYALRSKFASAGSPQDALSKATATIRRAAVTYAATLLTDGDMLDDGSMGDTVGIGAQNDPWLRGTARAAPGSAAVGTAVHAALLRGIIASVEGIGGEGDIGSVAPIESDFLVALAAHSAESGSDALARIFAPLVAECLARVAPAPAIVAPHELPLQAEPHSRIRSEWAWSTAPVGSSIRVNAVVRAPLARSAAAGPRITSPDIPALRALSRVFEIRDVVLAAVKPPTLAALQGSVSWVDVWGWGHSLLLPLQRGASSTGDAPSYAPARSPRVAAATTGSDIERGTFLGRLFALGATREDYTLPSGEDLVLARLQLAIATEEARSRVESTTDDDDDVPDGDALTVPLEGFGFRPGCGAASDGMAAVRGGVPIAPEGPPSLSRLLPPQVSGPRITALRRCVEKSIRDVNFSVMGGVSQREPYVRAIFERLVRAPGGSGRDAVFSWFGSVLDANAPRSTLAFTGAHDTPATSSLSSGSMLAAATAAMLALTRPFSDPAAPASARIDPRFIAAPTCFGGAANGGGGGRWNCLHDDRLAPAPDDAGASWLDARNPSRQTQFIERQMHLRTAAARASPGLRAAASPPPPPTAGEGRGSIASSPLIARRPAIGGSSATPSVTPSALYRGAPPPLPPLSLGPARSPSAPTDSTMGGSSGPSVAAAEGGGPLGWHPVTEMFWLALGMLHITLIPSLSRAHGLLSKGRQAAAAAAKDLSTLRAARHVGSFGLQLDAGSQEAYMRWTFGTAPMEAIEEGEVLAASWLFNEDGLVRDALRLFRLAAVFLLRLSTPAGWPLVPGLFSDEAAAVPPASASVLPSVVVDMPLPPPPPVYCALPAWVLNDVAEFLQRTQTSPLRPVLFKVGADDRSLTTDLLSFAVTFLASPLHIANPYSRGALLHMLSAFVPNSRDPWRYRDASHVPPLHRVIGSHEVAIAHVMPAVAAFYVDIASAGSHTVFYDKFNFRDAVSSLMCWLLDHETAHRESLNALARSGSASFIRFGNEVVNDADYVLGEALKSLEDMRDVEQQREDVAAWMALPADARNDADSKYAGATSSARYWLGLARELLGLLARLTACEPLPWLAPPLRERLSLALGYYLNALVGKGRGAFRIRNATSVGFSPRALLLDIMAVYTSLAVCVNGGDGFLRIVATDARSYFYANFTEAARLLSDVSATSGELPRDRLASVASILQSDLLPKLQAAAAALAADDAELGDVPDELTDPLMATLLVDPVLLPTSGTVMDREHATHSLLNEERDPFNRAFLVADALEPLPVLAEMIKEWVRQRRLGDAAAAATALAAATGEKKRVEDEWRDGQSNARSAAKVSAALAEAMGDSAVALVDLTLAEEMGRRGAATVSTAAEGGTGEEDEESEELRLALAMSLQD